MSHPLIKDGKPLFMRCHKPHIMACLAVPEVLDGTKTPCSECSPHLAHAVQAHKTKALVKSGWAGISKNPPHHIVDRREEPTATPMPENSQLGIPKPQTL